MHPLYAALPTSIFEIMSGHARDAGAVNLGQGFPDFGWPDDVVAKAADALRTASNQYAPMRGLPELREAVAEHYRTQQELAVTADQVLVTSGATEAIAAAILALVGPGDEVVMFAPLYDAYLPMVERAGGTARVVRLTPPDWRITAEAIAEAITPATKLLILNNPHNPSGRAFSPEELGFVAQACVAHDLIALSDEVWEHILSAGHRHVPLSSLPGMAERTVKIGSAGKIFSLTGWKIGWAVAAPPLATLVSKAHQFLTFATPPNLQAAVAYGLAKERSYFDGMRAGFDAARGAMIQGLLDLGYAVLPSEGTYFLCVDLAASGLGVTDIDFCLRAVKEAGVAGIPLSPFYPHDPATNVVRLCFAKSPETLERGLEGLSRARRLFA